MIRGEDVPVLFPDDPIDIVEGKRELQRRILEQGTLDAIASWYKDYPDSPYLEDSYDF